LVLSIAAKVSKISALYLIRLAYMKTSLVVLAFLVISCCASKGSRNEATSATPLTDSVLIVKDSIPPCLQKLVKKFSEEEKQSPPRSILSYTYQGKLVYYVPAICCDFFSDLYDADCKLLGHPDGGFTGRGDGNFADFVTARSGEKLIWKDNR
jgi:hypothetical protein